MSTAATIASSARFMIKITDRLVEDIPAEQFADRHGTTINHPAFVLGHLGYYVGVAMEFLGGDAGFDPNEATLYEHGAECLDDASRYPAKDACIASFKARMTAAADFVASCDDAALEASSAGTFFEDRMDTMGEVTNFILIGHVPLHLGQISAWRRVAGMGPAT